MKYSDLIQFEAIESVIELRQADKAEQAKHLVETFVISDRMQENLSQLIFPQLQFDRPMDNKGLLIVGNYGTGKSHLMALVSSIAENKELVSYLSNQTVAEAAGLIAGKFKVVRAELGSTEMSLRNAICQELERHLAKMGVTYEFPPADKVSNNKDSLIEMMGLFQQEYPDYGLLFVLDELLDFLRSRKQQEMMLDLGFLREVGEVCKDSGLRFVAGVQETLFDNPAFQFAAESLRRVQARFEQVRIAREDVAFVVSQRLLKKTPAQEGQIREHLTPFACLYSDMNERMEDYVRLFPVHPAYLETFEKVYVAEKREVLKTISKSMRSLLDQEVPAELPGLIAYDEYWQHLKENASFRAIPDIRRVIEKSTRLENIIEQSYARKHDKPIAKRIIAALSVHRLTTGDVTVPVGATAENLRDDLCLLMPLPQKDANFLKMMVEKVLVEITKTVSGQFLSHNQDNGQYYLDLDKDIDYDALIQQKADTLSKDTLDSHYFDALARVMEITDQAPYVPGYKIWEYDVQWHDRKVDRKGYLFFGAPNERSTAQPPRDFYNYFLQLYDIPSFKKENNSDEVFFRLANPDEAFEQALKLYSGAREMALTAEARHKVHYEKKANDQLKNITGWLREHMTTAFQVRYQDQEKTLREWVKGHNLRELAGISPQETLTVRDQVNVIAGLVLGSHFENSAPKYPRFTIRVTTQNMQQTAKEALRWIAGMGQSKQGTAVLHALNLLDGSDLKPRESEYAKQVIQVLNAKPQGQVLNRSELVHRENGADYWTQFRMEPEWLVVVLASLVYSGDLVISLPGKKIDATALDQLATMSFDDLVQFNHVERPGELPLAALKELLSLLGVPEGLIVNAATRDEAVAKLQVKVEELIKPTVLAANKVQTGLIFWNQPLLSEAEKAGWQQQLQSFKDFLESVQPFNTQGRLKNFKLSVEQIQAQKSNLDCLRIVERLESLIQSLAGEISYLGLAEAVLPPDHPWAGIVKNSKADLMVKMTTASFRDDPKTPQLLAQAFGRLKQSYRDAYLDLHRKARLSAAEDQRKGALNKDQRLVNLRLLASIPIVPSSQLDNLLTVLLELKTCFSLAKHDLENNAICPHCHYRPINEGAPQHSPDAVLNSIETQLDTILKSWGLILLETLKAPEVAQNIELVSNSEGKEAVQAFIKAKVLPAVVKQELVAALLEIFSGLERVKVTEGELRAALEKDKAPCTVEELKSRFDDYVDRLTRGKAKDKVRIVFE